MEKARSYEEIYRQADQFVLTWRDAAGDERQEAQVFVRDLLSVYGLTETRAALYERRARRSSTGGDGYIDALVPGKLAIEMKSRHRDLAAAEDQALDYLNSLPEAEFPEWVLTSDFSRFRLLHLTADGDGEPEEWALDDFRDHADKLAFLAGYGQRVLTVEDREDASIEAARLMASLYEGLAESGYDDHSASVFMVRTLFMLYADDTALWGERDLFLEFLEHRTSEDGGDLGSQMHLLFQVLRTPVERRQKNMTGLLARFPYVNGGLFEEIVDIPIFDSDMRHRLIEACYFNWSAISPAIFGSLFQAIKDKAARRSLGEHYTTERNILRLIGPLFLDELRAEYKNKRDSVQGLRNLRERLGQLQFLDPACGCGNFLIIAYREMRSLELEIIERIQQLQADRKSTSVLDQGLFFMGEQVSVRVRNFHGIELEDWPARIAATALHLVEHQANLEMQARLGAAPEMLPLDKVETIHTGNALTMDWNAVVPAAETVHVMGNPPFLGHATRTTQQADELRAAWGRKDIGRLDYVTGWYAKTLNYFSTPPGGSWAFVSTSSIAQGEPVPALFGPVFAEGWRIKFAHRTFAWTSEAPGAASVHCTIIGFDRRRKPAPRLFHYTDLKAEAEEEPAQRINAYLLDAPSMLVDQRRSRLSPELGAATFGNMPRDGGHLVVKEADYEQVANDPVAAKYLRPFVGSEELVNSKHRWCLWLEDLEPGDVTKSPQLKARLEAVRTFRGNSSAASTRKMAQTPHLFGQRSQPTTDYVCIPRVVSESRPFMTVQLLSAETIVSDACFKIPDPDGFQFAVLSSSMFMAWQRLVGGRLKSDIRFSNTIVWNNLPLPTVDESTRQHVITAGEEVRDARAQHPERSLAEHYNPLAMGPALLKAHQKLDRAVDKAFGPTEVCASEVDRQELLFASYARMVEAA